jgi:hypothetical protein
MLIKICTRPAFATDFAKATSVKAMLRRTKTAKNAPYPPRPNDWRRSVGRACTPWRSLRSVRVFDVTAFWLKYQDPNRCYRRVTGPLCKLALWNRVKVKASRYFTGLAPRYPDITCWDFTLGPLYCRAVSFNLLAYCIVQNCHDFLIFVRHIRYYDSDRT